MMAPFSRHRKHSTESARNLNSGYFDCLLAYSPSAIDRAFAAATAFVIRLANPSSAIKTASAAAVVHLCLSHFRAE
jgi:hypothetical protein